MTKHLDPMHPDNEHRADLSEWLPASAIPSPYKGDERLDERTPGFVRLPKADTFPALGELPVRGEDAPRPEFVKNDNPWHAPLTAADVAYPHAYAGAVGSKADVDATISEKIREHAEKGRGQRFRMLALDEVSEVVDYDITPKAHDELDAALLADDPLHKQMLPPAVPEVTSPAFKLGVLVGMLVASGVWYALPRLVEGFQ